MASKPMIIYRPFLWLEIRQDIETMLYNANDVLKAYNSSHKKKKIEDFMENKSTKEFIYQIESEEKRIKLSQKIEEPIEAEPRED